MKNQRIKTKLMYNAISKSTPIYINNFNRRASLVNMVEFLYVRGFRNIHIIDNASTYPLLLEDYAAWDAGRSATCATVHRLRDNGGAHSFFNSGFAASLTSDFAILTDSDLELNPNMPDNFLDIMWTKMQVYNERKCGLALRIDDIPDTAYGKTHIQVQHEEQFWQTKLEENVYRAAVDTTFCLLFKPTQHDYSAIRIAGDFTCRHLPWYQDFNNMSEEELYFVNHSNPHSNYACHYRKFVGNPM